MKRSSTTIVFTVTLLSLMLFTACAGGEDGDTSMPDTEAMTDTAMTDPGMTDPTTTDPGTAGQDQQKINLNTASEAEFQSIPNVGERMVGEFIEYRPYVSIRQFREEIGKYVDDELVTGYERYVFVPVDPNESDEATLQQIPGVNEAVAAELVDGRPYATDEEFLEALSQRIAPDQVAMAERYLAD